MKTSLNAFFALGAALLSNAQTINLARAAAFGALAPAGITNTGITVINGDIGTTGTSITGFPPGIYTGSLHIADAQAAGAQADATAARVRGQGLSPTVNKAGLMSLDGLTLVAGVYKFTAAVNLRGTLVLSGPGTFIFQLASSLTTFSASRILLTNGATACNVYWIVGSAATIGSSSTFAGNILAGTAITVGTGASISGGLYAGSAVTLQSNNVLACGANLIRTSTSAASATLTPPAASTLPATVAPAATSSPPATSAIPAISTLSLPVPISVPVSTILLPTLILGTTTRTQASTAPATLTTSLPTSTSLSRSRAPISSSTFKTTTKHSSTSKTSCTKDSAAATTIKAKGTKTPTTKENKNHGWW